jgi:lipopolysaccharide biosynthesis glycosyltransferase
VYSAVDDALPAAVAIRHFTDHRKPWLESCRDRDRVYHRYYRDALHGTPWSRFVHPRDWSLRQITYYWRHYHDPDRRRIRAILRATLAKYGAG